MGFELDVRNKWPMTVSTSLHPQLVFMSCTEIRRRIEAEVSIEDIDIIGGCKRQKHWKIKRGSFSFLFYMTLPTTALPSVPPVGSLTSILCACMFFFPPPCYIHKRFAYEQLLTV